MRSLSGLLLLTAGLTVGAFAYYPGDGSPRDLAEITRIMARGAEQSEPGASGWSASAPRLFSPQSPLVALEDPTRLASLERKSAAGERAKPLAAEDAATWSTVVAAAPVSAPRQRLSSTRPADEASRYELVRDLQRELKRVGCYHGEIDGDWGPGSKRAMSTFIERVNATLPTGDPDYILLMLVQGQTQPACGSGCPSGQVAAEEGRCVPKAIVAQARPKPQVKTEHAPSVTAAEPPPQARPAEAGPSLEAAAPALPAAAVASAAVPAPKPARKPVVLAAKSTDTVASDTTPSSDGEGAREPLPGRMTVGGPVVAAEPPPVLAPAPKLAARTLGEHSGVGKADRVAAVEPDRASSAGESETVAPRRQKPKHTVRSSPRRSESATWVSPPPKKRSPQYATAPRRGGSSANRPGTPRFNLLLSLGGIF